MRLLTILAAGAALGACTTMSETTTTNSYQAEYDTLRAHCDARGGTLEPIGALNGRPATDYACMIRSGPVTIRP